MSDPPRVALVTGATGLEHLDWTRAWLASVRRTDYPALTVDLVDDGGELAADLAAELASDRDVRVHPAPKTRSLSEVFNRALGLGLEHDPDYVLLLTTSTRPTRPDWLRTLVAHAEPLHAAGGGIMGTRNVNPDGTLNHAGMTLVRLPGSQLLGVHLGRDADRSLPPGMFTFDRQVECVTGASLLLDRRVLDAGIRFDPRLRQNSNDVDLCLQARAKGFTIGYCGHVVLWRDEAHTRGHGRFALPPADVLADHRYFCAKWAGRPPAW